ncbi:glycolipid ABC transporter membrane protein [Chondrocystis sp. NIES-4102]|nr:glycolipid ABC transporter membrane protein [Chondrocystis sp. NIES-4102]
MNNNPPNLQNNKKINYQYRPQSRQQAIILDVKTSLLLMALALTTLGFTSYYTLKNSNIISNYQAKTSTAPKTITTANTNLNNRVAAIGYIQTKQDPINLSATTFVEGARVQELLVKRTDQVKVGQIIAILDNRDRLLAAYNQAQKQVTVANARLQQVQAGAKTGEIQAQKAKFQATEAELQGQIDTQKAAIANLNAQLAGQTNAQKATINRLKAEVENATKECQRYKQLSVGGAISASEKDSICLKQTTSQDQLLEANVNLQRITNTLGEQINEAKSNLQRTINTLDQQIIEAQSSLEAVAEVRDVDVAVAMSELETAKSAVSKAEAELDLAYVRSPIDGQILQINTWAGETINNTKGIVTLGDTANMYVVAEVYETDINKIKIGQQATIDSGGITSKLTGTVEEIGLQIGTKDVLGTDPVADADARVVEVKIRLTPEASKQVTALTNLQVNVIINTNS